MNAESFTGNRSHTIISRRDSMVYIGGSLWAVLSGCSAPVADVVRKEVSENPRLRSDVVLVRMEDSPNLREMLGGDIPACALNGTAWQVARLLDGRHSVGDIAGQLWSAQDPVDAERRKADVACFLSQLAMAGFLERPYFVQIIERETS